MHKKFIYYTAFLWGFAEASLFFIIPDVFLSFASINYPKTAIKACLITALGACLGGTLLYYWGYYDYQSATWLLSKIPGIYPSQIEQVKELTLASPYTSLLFAPLKGTPYKIYAASFGLIKINLITFILISFVARVSRFLIITTCSSVICCCLKKIISTNKIKLMLIATWVLIYIVYFYQMHSIYFNA